MNEPQQAVELASELMKCACCSRCWRSISRLDGTSGSSCSASITVIGAFARTVDSIRRKFAVLYRCRIPTGNPTYPAEVRTVKRIRFLMTQLADIGEGDNIANAELGLPPDDNAALHLPGTPAQPAPDAAAAIAADPAPPAPLSQEGPSQFFPRPIVNRHAASADWAVGDDDITALVKFQLLQSQEEERARREEERVRREEGRQRWETERARREEER